MNIPRYLLNENIKNDFLQFLKEANEAKSDVNCDLKKYDEMITLFPLQSEIEKELKTYVENANIYIDITQSDEETEPICKPTQDTENDHMLNEVNDISSNSFQTLEKTNINDIIDCIKDSLYISNELSILIKDLFNLDNNELDKVFSSLANQLSLEEIINFWRSLMSSNNRDYIILCYVKFVFLPRAKQEFTYELETILSSMIQKCPTVMKNELVIAFLEIDPTETEANRVLQQYVGTLNNDFRTDVLRHFIYTCEKLHPNYISIVEALLNPQSDYDILSKLVEVMSNAVTEFTTDNAYGKLLFNVVNLLERNVCRLDQPLKHILGIHRSIWKIKVQKAVVTWFDDSLTQSFV